MIQEHQSQVLTQLRGDQPWPLDRTANRDRRDPPAFNAVPQLKRSSGDGACVSDMTSLICLCHGDSPILPRCPQWSHICVSSHLTITYPAVTPCAQARTSSGVFSGHRHFVKAFLPAEGRQVGQRVREQPIFSESIYQ